MPKADPYQLTPADLMDLRCWAGRTGFISDGLGHITAAPWITYGINTHEYFIHSGGFTVAATDRDDLACYLLRQERIEPGYIRRILDPALDVQLALEPPETRRAYTAQRNAEAAQRRAQEAETAEALRRRASHLDPTKVNIEDLL